MTKDRTSGGARREAGGASTLDLSGRQVGSSYILLKPIGQGATGTVWQGRDQASGELVAIKLLHESLLRQPKLVTRFVQERTILLMLRHRNVVRVRDLFSVGETLGLVMDLVSGGSLRDHLRRHRTVAPAEAARLGAQIAAALSEAHELGVVHRDLKPDNVLLQTEGRRLETRLTDFGVARILNTPSMTTPNAVVGTPHYMSPEAFHSATPSPATDVYALGVLLYELVCGRPPYDSDSIPDLMRRHMEGDPYRPPGIPESLWEVISSCLATKPQLRPPAEELTAELSDISRNLRGCPALPAPPGVPIDPSRFDEPSGVLPPVPPAVPRQKRNRRRFRPGAAVTVLATTVLASAVAVGAWQVGREREDATPRLIWRPTAAPSHNVTTAARAGSGQHRSVTAAASSIPAVRSEEPRPKPSPHPATPHSSARSEQHSHTVEAQAYGPWQCSPTIAFDFVSKTPMAPTPCQMTGRDIRYQASLTAPGGATGRITITLQDAASGRTVAGPKVCTGLNFTGSASTKSCGSAAAAPARGHFYAVVMSYSYEQAGHTMAGTAHGESFSW